MKLTVGTGGEIEAPSAEQVEGALRGLPGGSDSFAILEQDEQTYIQTSGGPADGFVLEYREGSPTSHFRCTDHQLPPDVVVAAFLAYLDGRADYKSQLGWEHDRPDTGRGSRVAFAVLGVLAALAFTLYRCGS